MILPGMSAGVRRHEALQLAAIWPNKNPAALIGNPPALIWGHRRVRPRYRNPSRNPHAWSGAADPSALTTRQAEGAFRRWATEEGPPEGINSGPDRDRGSMECGSTRSD
jgi:hypothetical protein